MTTNFQDLPYEVQFDILLEVGYPALTEYCRTSRSGKQLCDDDLLWNALYKKDFPKIPRRSESAKRDYLTVYRTLRRFADDLTEEYSQINRKYANLQGQSEDVFNEIVTFINSLSNIGIIKEWANLDRPHPDEDALDNYVYEESSSLIPQLRHIMVGLSDEASREVFEQLHWDSQIRLFDLHDEIPELLRKFFSNIIDENSSSAEKFE